MNEEAFVRAILADSGDDVLRLAYADWLEESGDVARVEYLRLLCRLSGASPPDAELPLLARLEELRAGIEHAWVGLMHRGRALPSVEPPSIRLYEGSDNVAEAMARHNSRERADIGIFLQQYGRKGCNDRSYSRKVEKRVKRMKPEELDRLIRGEED